MLDLASANRSQRAAHDRVVDAQHVHRHVVAQGLGQLRGTHDVGEHHAADSRIALIVRSRREHRTGRIDAAVAHESLDHLGFDFDDLLGDEPVRLPVHGAGRVGRGCVHEAENLAATFIEPVLEVLDTELPLHREIGLVRLRERIGSRAFDRVDVQIERHAEPL